MSAAINITDPNWPDWTTDPSYVSWTGQIVGFTAQSLWHNQTMADVVLLLAGFYATHNVSNNETLLLSGDIANLLGTTTESVAAMWEYCSGDDDKTGVDTSRALTGGAAVVINDYRTIYKDVRPPQPPNLHTHLPVFVILSVVAAAVLSTRFYSRTTYPSYSGIFASDWVMLVGYIMTFLMGFFIVLFQENVTNYNTWDWDKTYDDFGKGQYWLLIIYVCYPIPIFAIKTSWLLFYYNLTVWNPLRWGVIGMFVFVLGNTIAAFATQLWAVFPIDWWNHFFTMRGLLQSDRAFIATGSLNVLTDIMIWVLPLPLVWNLSISRRERLVGLITFGFGAIACVASIFRLIYIHESYTEAGPSTIDHAADLRLYTIIEMYLGIIGGCVPSVRALITRLQASSSSRNTNNTSNLSNPLCHPRSSRSTDNFKEPEVNYPLFNGGFDPAELAAERLSERGVGGLRDSNSTVGIGGDEERGFDMLDLNASSGKNVSTREGQNDVESMEPKVLLETNPPAYVNGDNDKNTEKDKDKRKSLVVDES